MEDTYCNTKALTRVIYCRKEKGRFAIFQGKQNHEKKDRLRNTTEKVCPN